MRWIRYGLLALCLLAGCSKAGTNDVTHRKPLTEAQRDSLIARSPLPGAPVVGRTLAVRDSAQARAARMNAATR